MIGRLPAGSNVERGASELRARILSGELAPGHPLREVALAAELGVSRNTLREILLVLAGEGLVRHEPNRGASVVQLGVRDARDIYLVRRLVELPAIEQAAAGPARELEPLGAALERLAESARERDLDLLVEADLAFHRTLAGVLGSERVSALFRTIETQLRLAFSIVASADREHERPEPLIAEHEELLRLALAGDTAEARHALVTHLGKYERRLVAVLAEHEAATAEQRREAS